MGGNIFKKIKKIIKYTAIALVVFAFAFSDFISVLPMAFQNNKLAENFRVHEAQAAIATQFPVSNSVYSSGGFTNPANLYSDNASYGTSTPAKNSGQGNIFGNFGFDSIIPSGAIINSVKIIYEFKLNTTASNASQRVITRVNGIEQLIHDNTAEPLTDTIVNVDITADRSWARADLLDGVFEVIAESRRVGGSGSSYTASWDYVKVEVDYTLFSGPDATSVTYQVGGDGARSGYSATIDGVNFGIVADGSQEICAGGVGTGCVRFIVGGNTTVADVDVTNWSDSSITFIVDDLLSSYGGAASLQVVSAGVIDTTPLDFYIYPNITSASANSGQIGSVITISGDHFGVASGTAVINTKTVAIGTWSETNLVDVKIPGQEGLANITGKIQLTRADAKTSNQYPVGNFTILAPSVTGSNPSSAATGQIISIEFSGQGIDTDTGTAPILKLTKGQPADCTASATCIFGTGYAKVTNYQAVSASFDLTGAATGYWKIVVINMDTQFGSFGNEVTTGFNITPLAPTVTGINPDFGKDSGITDITSIIGTNFQSGATVKLTKTAQTDIVSSTAFIFTDSGTLSDGAFDLTGKALFWWNVVVTNPDLQTASYGDESTFGFEIRSAKPSLPTNVYQFKTSTDIDEPPTTNIAVGEGIGGQTEIYFRMDMEGGLVGRYYPQVEVKPIGAAFECTNASPTPCIVTDGFFVENSIDIFSYDGITPVQGWASIIGVDGALYHWQVRVRNSSGVSNWVSFGGNLETEKDVYIDTVSPVITLGTDDSCASAAPIASITDLNALVKWSTSDETSGAAVPPGSGPYARGQVEYKKGVESWAATALSAWENSPHEVVLSGLAPATTYIFRIRAQDYLGNETISSECTFDTISSRPIKTVEFFIGQEIMQNTGAQIIKPFNIYIPEGQSVPATDISVKSAFIEITGISSDGSQTINVGLLRGNQTIPPVGADYDIDSTGTTTPFLILFDVLAPQGSGQENMTDIVYGNNYPYEYTLFLKGNGITVSAFSAKLIITYSYAQ